MMFFPFKKCFKDEKQVVVPVKQLKTQNTELYDIVKILSRPIYLIHAWSVQPSIKFEGRLEEYHTAESIGVLKISTRLAKKHLSIFHDLHDILKFYIHRNKFQKVIEAIENKYFNEPELGTLLDFIQRFSKDQRCTHIGPKMPNQVII